MLDLSPLRNHDRDCSLDTTVRDEAPHAVQQRMTISLDYRKLPLLCLRRASCI